MGWFLILWFTLPVSILFVATSFEMLGVIMLCANGAVVAFVIAQNKLSDNSASIGFGY